MRWKNESRPRYGRPVVQPRMKRSVPLATIALISSVLLAYAAELAFGGPSVCRAFGFRASKRISPRRGYTTPEHTSYIVGNAVHGIVVEPVLGRWPFVSLFSLSALGGGADRPRSAGELIRRPKC